MPSSDAQIATQLEDFKNRLDEGAFSPGLGEQTLTMTHDMHEAWKSLSKHKDQNAKKKKDGIAPIAPEQVQAGDDEHPASQTESAFEYGSK